MLRQGRRYPPQLLVEPFTVVDVTWKGLLQRDRDADDVGLEPARIDPARAVAKHAADLPGQERAQGGVVELRERPHGLDADAGEPFGAARPDAGQLAHGQRAEEVALASGKHNGDAARLARVRGDLGDDLRPRDAERA